MAQFHPNIHWLVDYSSGTLPLANALCVTAHLEYCSSCSQRVAELNALGGSLLRHDRVDPVAEAGENAALQGADNADNPLLQSVFDAIDAQTTSPADAAPAGTPSCVGAEDLPTCVQKLLPNSIDDLGWRRLGPTLSVARLGAGDERHEVALHRLRAGGGVADHDHRGEEVTVVLKGSFSDQRGIYLPGDFLLMTEGEQHRPTASVDMDCICLSSVEAPIRFTGPVARLLNPFMKIRPGL